LIRSGTAESMRAKFLVDAAGFLRMGGGNTQYQGKKDV
jgi:hypothetical protein